MTQPPVTWLHLLLLAAAAARTRTAAGADCSAGVGCLTDIALGSYIVTAEQNLTYISSLFGIYGFFENLAPYNPAFPNLAYIQAGDRLNVYFPCRCFAPPSAPSSSYLAGSFPYRVSQGETYASVAAKFHNLTTASLLQTATAPSRSSVNDVLDAGTAVNVTIPCSCPSRGVSQDYSVVASYGLSSPAEVDLFRRYNPHADSPKEGDVVCVPVKDGNYNGIIATTTITGPRKIKKIIVTSAIAGTSGLLVASTILVLFFLWYKKYYGMLPWQKWSRNAPRIESFLQKQGTSHPKRYKLGQGGYGAVYRGNLADGREIPRVMARTS